MRLPRNFKMLRGPMDSAALTGSLCLLWIVTLLHSSLVMPAGVRIDLPEAGGVLGEVLPRFSLAVDSAGRMVFEHQFLAESNLVARLRSRVTKSDSRPTLLLMADRQVPAETLARLITLVRSAGIQEVVLATSPRPAVSTTVPVVPGKRP